jgi:hypothetical protein
MNLDLSLLSQLNAFTLVFGDARLSILMACGEGSIDGFSLFCGMLAVIRRAKRRASVHIILTCSIEVKEYHRVRVSELSVIRTPVDLGRREPWRQNWCNAIIRRELFINRNRT